MCVQSALSSSCAAGKYSKTGTDSSGCTSCSTGYYSASAGLTACASCPEGYFSTTGATSCAACMAGYYSNTTGSSSACMSCPKGYFSTTGASSCEATLHDFDFRGCTTGSQVTDDFSLTATPYKGPICHPSGCTLMGLMITYFLQTGIGEVQLHSKCLLTIKHLIYGVECSILGAVSFLTIYV